MDGVREMKQNAMSQSLEAVLFDKDGTLVDFHATWSQGYADAARLMARQLGGDKVDAAALMRGAGMDPGTFRVPAASVMGCGTTPEIAANWAATLGLADSTSLARDLEAFFLDEIGSNPVAVACLDDTLVRLAAAGFRLGVATMDSAAMAERNLGLMGVRDRFEFVCGFDSGFGHKPTPGMVEAFSSATQVSAARIAMVGDSPHDLNMGRSAQVGLVVGVLTGAGVREELEPIADVVLDSIADLPSLLGISV
jgi:phosphoglycolate phosphatase